MRLFISYAHANRSKVEELQELLEKAGNEVWFDSELMGGDNWWQRILSEIERCEVFIFALSPEATDSIACRTEFQYALDLNKPILPIMLRQAELPIGRLQETQYVDARHLNNHDVVLNLMGSLLNLQKLVSSGEYSAPSEPIPRPDFPFEADPLKDLRERVKDLSAASEDEIVNIVFRIKQLARLSNRTSHESRQLLNTIMTSPHIPHSAALEARDALAALPTEHSALYKMRIPIGILAVVVVIVVGVLGSGILSSTAQETPTASVTAPPASPVVPTITSAPSQPPDTPSPVPSDTPVLTPFGGGAGVIAFASKGDGNYEIYTLNLGSGALTNLTHNAADDREPAWSPDGSKIAFASDRGGNWEIYVMNADGSNPINLTNGATDNREPAWSPDGSKIAFRGNVDRRGEIYVMNADGSNPINLSNHPADDSDPAWSPDGSKIAFASYRDLNWEIYVMDARGNNPSNLTQDRATMPANDRTPRWSPDGSKIAFYSNRDGNSEIYMMNADGSNMHNLTLNPAIDINPAWSPDGSQIAFVTNRNGEYQLFRMNINGGLPNRMDNSSLDEYEPAWQPRGGG